VKMYWLDTADQDRTTWPFQECARRAIACVHSRMGLVRAITTAMKPLIGVTTSELRPSGAGTLRRHGENMPARAA